jgi:hypothetical protein
MVVLANMELVNDPECRIGLNPKGPNFESIEGQIHFELTQVPKIGFPIVMDLLRAGTGINGRNDVFFQTTMK